MARFVVLALLLALTTGSEAAPAAPGFKVRLIDGKTTLDSRDLIGKKILDDLLKAGEPKDLKEQPKEEAPRS